MESTSDMRLEKNGKFRITVSVWGCAVYAHVVGSGWPCFTVATERISAGVCFLIADADKFGSSTFWFVALVFPPVGW